MNKIKGENIMSRIVAVRKDGNGTITDYKLDNGKELNHDQAIGAVNSGEIEGCNVFPTRDGGEAIRSNRGQDDYSLDSLPSF